ncbi:hypothetical protein V496_01698 [Pseudogymnoascus sp. VKM F-4515 (FW-2607)]|nr:hypothetical protein V496_01698 [Pseudogymnoascus sp. VKM F-4515 (FW-2607)]
MPVDMSFDNDYFFAAATLPDYSYELAFRDASFQPFAPGAKRLSERSDLFRWESFDRAKILMTRPMMTWGALKEAVQELRGTQWRRASLPFAWSRLSALNSTADAVSAQPAEDPTTDIPTVAILSTKKLSTTRICCGASDRRCFRRPFGVVCAGTRAGAGRDAPSNLGGGEGPIGWVSSLFQERMIS